MTITENRNIAAAARPVPVRGLLRTVELPTLPFCDFCRHPSNGCKIVPANYDTKTKFGPWAHVCEAHLSQYGTGMKEKVAQPDVPAQRAGGPRPLVR